MPVSREQLLRDCESRLDEVEHELDSNYVQSLKTAIRNARKYLWTIKEVSKIWEEIESL